MLVCAALLLHRNDLPHSHFMVQIHRSLFVTLAKAMTQDVHIPLSALPMKHCQHKAVVRMGLELPMLPARIIIPIEQVYKVPKFLLRSTQVLPSMVPEPEAVAAHMLLHPDHVVAVVVAEEIHQFRFWICCCAQEAVITVLPALTRPQQDATTCICSTAS